MTDKEFKQYFPFDFPRKGQRELIEQVITAFNKGKKHVILNAPTGWGKSVIAYTLVSYFKNGYILTSQKCLQEQYHKDLKIPYVLGRTNYKCKKNIELTCEIGMCKGKGNLCNDCPYRYYRDKCFESNISNLNYSYFLTLNNTVHLSNDDNIIEPRELIVCDECHNCENELINLCTLKLYEKTFIHYGITEKLPRKNTSNETIFKWLFEKFKPILEMTSLGYKNQIKHFNLFKMTREYKMVLHKYTTISKLLTSLKEIETQYNKNHEIIINRDDETLEFKLLYADDLFKQMIEPSANKFLHMSATVLNKNEYCKNLGLSLDDVEYISVDAIFPKENRLIYFTPIGSMTYNNKARTFPKLINKIDELLGKYSNVKGIIHTVNYNIAEVILNKLKNTKNGDRLLMPRGNDRQDILDIFYNTNEPLVLISPSLTEGLDLKDDLSRFCLICKVPYASLADQWVKERAAKDNIWYMTSTAQTLIQMTGRSIRSADDYCDTYILDSNFEDFAKKSYNIFPEWWKESVIIN